MINRAFLNGFMDKLAQHILVSGHSGAGKTTLAKQLGEEHGYPVVHIDDDARHKEFLAQHEDQRHLTDPALREEWRSLQHQMLIDAIAEAGVPSVIEGTHITAASPETLEGHRAVLVDTPEETIVRQRLARSREKPHYKDKLAPGSANAREKARFARMLIDAYRDDVEAYRPGAELMRPNRP